MHMQFLVHLVKGNGAVAGVSFTTMGTIIEGRGDQIPKSVYYNTLKREFLP